MITLFWTPITAFVGALANINYLTSKVPFLSFINSMPPVILGVVTGLLPVIVLAICFILVPIICRLLAKLAGAATLTGSRAQDTILVLCLSSHSSLPHHYLCVRCGRRLHANHPNSPSSAPTLLAKNLPKASNFYISYFILYGLLQAALQLLMIVPASHERPFSVLFLDKTPRKKYSRWTSLAGLGWGSEYPKWTNLGVIALSYACIAPLILRLRNYWLPFPHTPHSDTTGSSSWATRSI